MSKSSNFLAGTAVTTAWTSPGYKGEGLSVSPDPETLATSGFRRRDALEMNMTLSTFTLYQTSILVMFGRVAHVDVALSVVSSSIVVKRVVQVVRKYSSEGWIFILSRSHHCRY